MVFSQLKTYQTLKKSPHDSIVKKNSKKEGRMTLFPQLSDSYYVENDHNVLKMMDNTYAKYITINQSFWSEADIDNRFLAGDQGLYNDVYGNVPSFRRRQFNFNRIRRIINMISGYQRQHRKSTMVTPIEPSAQHTADQFTKLLYHTNHHGNVLETISSAFEGAITSGMNLLSTWIDYTRDPVNGDIKVDNVSYNGYLIDPYFKNKDLSDCNSLWTRKYLSRNQVMALLPGREDEIKGMSGFGNKDGKFQFMPEAYSYCQQDLVIYDEFWYLDSRSQQLIVDTDSGEAMEWRGVEEDLNEFLQMYPQTVVMKNEIPSVKLAIVVQGKVMYHGPNPMGIDCYPYVPVWAYFQPEIPYFPWRIQGVVRGIRDAQYLYNRRVVTSLDILESQINSGWKYKENALVNPKDVFLQGQGRGLALKAEAQMTDVEQILPPQLPPSMLQLSEMLGNELTQISGVNEELLGSAIDEKAGILSALRQGAGLVTLQGLFDNLDQSQRLLGKIHLQLIQANWTPGKVARILSDEPSPEFYNRAFSQYDALVEEAPLTSTQRQLALQQALYLKEIGIPIPTEYLLENMQLPKKDELMAKIRATEEQQTKQEQQMAQIQMQQIEADNATKAGFAESQKAMAAERMNKIHLDTAVGLEKMEKAETDKSMAFLNLIKAVKELQGIDISQIAQVKSMLASPQIQQEMDVMQQQSQMQQAQQAQQMSPQPMPQQPEQQMSPQSMLQQPEQ